LDSIFDIFTGISGTDVKMRVRFWPNPALPVEFVNGRYQEIGHSKTIDQRQESPEADYSNLLVTSI